MKVDTFQVASFLNQLRISHFKENHSECAKLRAHVATLQQHHSSFLASVDVIFLLQALKRCAYYYIYTHSRGGISLSLSHSPHAGVSFSKAQFRKDACAFKPTFFRVAAARDFLEIPLRPQYYMRAVGPDASRSKACYLITFWFRRHFWHFCLEEDLFRSCLTAWKSYNLFFRWVLFS